MNSTDRVMAAVNFKKPDRIPLWQVTHIGSFLRNWSGYLNVVENTNPADFYGYDTAIICGDESFFPSQRRKTGECDGYEIWNDEWGRVVYKKDDAYFIHTVDTALKKPEDLDGIVFEPADKDSRYTDMMKLLRQERNAGRCIFAKVGGIYNRSHLLVPEEDLLVYMAEDECFCNELFDRVTEHFTAIGLETLKRTDAWETGIFIFDDMASTYSNMFSPALFEKYFLPRYGKMIATLRKAGCKHFFLHSDGNIGPVLDLMLEAGFEGFNPLEPRSGLGLLKLRERYGKRIVAFGGVCNTEILPRGDRKEIEAHVKPLLELGREGGVVLGMASAAEDISPETYEYYMSLVQKYGNYDEQDR